MKKHLMKVAMAIAAAGWLGGATPSAHADLITLQDLLNGQSIVVGNSIFHNFQNFSSTGTGALAVDPSQVWVIPTMEGGKFGLKFQGNGQFAAGVNQFLSTHFEFLVSGRNAQYHGAALKLTASAHSDGNGHCASCSYTPFLPFADGRPRREPWMFYVEHSASGSFSKSAVCRRRPGAVSTVW